MNGVVALQIATKREPSPRGPYPSRGLPFASIFSGCRGPNLVLKFLVRGLPLRTLSRQLFLGSILNTATSSFDGGGSLLLRLCLAFSCLAFLRLQSFRQLSLDCIDLVSKLGYAFAVRRRSLEDKELPGRMKSPGA